MTVARENRSRRLGQTDGSSETTPVRVTTRIADPRDGLTPPHDVYAEEAVLGAMLHDPAAINAATPKLRAEDFYRPAHRTIFHAILKRRADGGAADPVTVAHDLARTGDLPDVGGAPFLFHLVEQVPLVSNVTHYARIVAELGHLRRVIDVGHRIVQLGYEEPDPPQATRLAEELVAEVRGTSGDERLTSRLALGGGFILDAPEGVPTVWGDGDQVVWPEGEPFLLCGPEGVGKTTIAQQLVLARLGIGDTVLGMPVTPGSRRVLYLACDRPAQVRRSFSRMVAEAHRDHLNNALVVWEGPPPEDFGKNPTVAYEMCKLADADTLVIDSEKDVALKLTDDEVGSSLNRAHQLCVANGVQVLGLHHQRKSSSNGDKPKTLADVYGSRWITAGAGSVALLWGEAGDPIVEWIHLKQPAGLVGPFKVIHDHRTGRSQVHNPTDLLALARGSKTGITAKDAAAAVFDTTRPSASKVEQARYKLDGLVAKNLLHRNTAERGPDGKQLPVRYVPVTALQEVAS